MDFRLCALFLNYTLQTQKWPHFWLQSHPSYSDKNSYSLDLLYNSPGNASGNETCFILVCSCFAVAWYAPQIIYCCILFQSYSLLCIQTFVPSIMSCPCNYGNSHCWLQTVPPIFMTIFSILSPRVSALLSHPFWPVKGVYLHMSIFSMNYIDCFCSQPCPEQSIYSFIPEKIHLISIFGVNFNIKVFCVNLILREDSTANKVKTSVLNV